MPSWVSFAGKVIYRMLQPSSRNFKIVALHRSALTHSADHLMCKGARSLILRLAGTCVLHRVEAKYVFVLLPVLGAGCALHTVQSSLWSPLSAPGLSFRFFVGVHSLRAQSKCRHSESLFVSGHAAFSMHPCRLTYRLSWCRRV